MIDNLKLIRPKAPLMKELGANAIRVFVSDPDGDHDECMNIFADAGIYVFVGLRSNQTIGGEGFFSSVCVWNIRPRQATLMILTEKSILDPRYVRRAYFNN